MIVRDSILASSLSFIGLSTMLGCADPSVTMTETASASSLTTDATTTSEEGSADTSTSTDSTTTDDSSTDSEDSEDSEDSDTADTADTADSETDTGDPPLDPELILFEEDFELAAQDSVPEGWDSFVAWQVNAANEPGGNVFALVDDSRPHEGNNSLHVKGSANPGMLTRPLPPGTSTIYVRSYVWLTQKMGQNPGNNHETLLGVRASVGQANDEVRFGEIKGVIGTNEVPSDDISPKMEQWGMGPVIAAGQWNCIEVAFVADAGAHYVEAWNNGEQVHLVDDPSQWNNMVLGEDFLDGKFVEFIIGWHSFSSYDNEVWFDDIVVALERVGC